MALKPCPQNSSRASSGSSPLLLGKPSWVSADLPPAPLLHPPPSPLRPTTPAPWRGPFCSLPPPSRCSTRGCCPSLGTPARAWATGQADNGSWGGVALRTVLVCLRCTSAVQHSAANLGFRLGVGICQECQRAGRGLDGLLCSEPGTEEMTARASDVIGRVRMEGASCPLMNDAVSREASAADCPGLQRMCFSARRVFGDVAWLRWRRRQRSQAVRAAGLGPRFAISASVKCPEPCGGSLAMPIVGYPASAWRARENSPVAASNGPFRF